MDFNLKLAGRKFIELNDKQENEELNNEQHQDLKQNSDVDIPSAKPITASIKDVLEKYTMGQVEMVSTVAETPKIKEGVTKFVLENSEVTTYKKDSLWGVQIRGSLNMDKLLDKIPELQETTTTPIVKDTQNTNATNEIDGDIDDGFEQGNTGDCWILSGVFALSKTDIGKQIIKDSIKVNEDGSVTITFKGVGVSYTITPEELAKHDTDNNKNDAYSNGDNDMLAIELAAEKLIDDIASGKVKLNTNDKYSNIDFNRWNASIGEGGFTQAAIYYFTGIDSETTVADDIRKGLPSNEVLDLLQKAYETGNTALSFGLYSGNHTATCTNGDPYQLRLNGGHALAITNLTQDTVTFVNPWDSTKEYTMTWEEFAKLKIGMFVATDLNSLVDDTNPNDNDDNIDPDDGIDGPDDINPNTPDIPEIQTYSFKELQAKGFNDSQIKLYFDCKYNDNSNNSPEAGTYTLKTGIKVTWYNGEIKTIEDLVNVLGLKSRNALKEKGLSDQFIDKYFNIQESKEKNTDGTPKFEFVLNKDYSNYTIQKNSDGTHTVKMTLASGEGIRTVVINADGSIVDKGIEKIDDKKPDNTPPSQIYNIFELIKYGFETDDITKYFDKVEPKNTDSNSRISRLLIEYTMKDGINIPHYDGEIKDAKDLANVLGLQSKQKLKTQGLTENVINKYFTLSPSNKGDIEENRAPIFEFKVNEEFKSYSITKMGKNIQLMLKRKDNDNILFVTIKPDGSFTERELKAIKIDNFPKPKPTPQPINPLPKGNIEIKNPEQRIVDSHAKIKLDDFDNRF